jgi:ribonuclease-3
MHVSFSVSTSPRSPLGKFVRLFFRLRQKQTSTSEAEKEFEGVIGYRFRSPVLLRQALTHKSAIAAEDTNGILSNERMEFLGDAVLNCLVTEYLYHRHPDKSEGQLSKIKSLVVSRKILGEVAQRINLGKYLIFGISEEKSGGRNRLSTMSNAFEAVLGAVYLDGGIDAAKQVLKKFLFVRITEFLQDERHVNYKSTILELSQSDGFGIPRYVTLDAKGPDHAKEFTVQIEVGGVVLGTGSGSNKKVAQQQAAQQAVEHYNKEHIQNRCKGESENELVPH